MDIVIDSLLGSRYRVSVGVGCEKPIRITPGVDGLDVMKTHSVVVVLCWGTLSGCTLRSGWSGYFILFVVRGGRDSFGSNIRSDRASDILSTMDTFWGSE
jgi:hypothetical protein